MPTSTTIQKDVDYEALSVIAKETDNAVMLTDTQSRIIWVNPKFEEITEYKLEEIVDKKPSSFLQGEFTSPDAVNRIRHKLKALEPFQEEVLNRTKSGRRFWLRMSVTPVFNDLGQHTHFLALESDVTQERAKEERLQMALKEQEELSRDLMLAQMKLQQVLSDDSSSNTSRPHQKPEISKEQLLQQEKLASVGVLTAGIAHEMNNPINFLVNGIQAFKVAFQDFLEGQSAIEEFFNKNLSEEAKQEFSDLKEEYENEELSDEMGAMLDDMQLGAKQTTEIVKGLKLFARGDAKNPEQIQVSELLDTALTLLKNKIKHRFEIIQEYDVNVKNIDGFPSSLTQVFMNIIQNAIHAFPEERKDGKITISTEKAANRVKIRIKDNGTGIPDEVKPKIFKPFFTTKGTGIGTGLGLPICKQIIEEQHDGQITFSSQEGYGTEFMIILPEKLGA